MTNYFQHMKTHLEILWQTHSRLCICNQLNESKTRNIKLEATADVPYIHYESNKKIAPRLLVLRNIFWI